ncbi:MAG: Gfo/Idh/MocA family oxidoreductase [Deltaproteobacteria bacterium]
MKILMVGLGGIGQRHLRNLNAILGAEAEFLAYRVRRLKHVVTDTLEIQSGGNIEEKYNIRSFSDLDEALAQKPEVVFICNPSSMHLPIAIKSAQQGCHLFLEKPLSHNMDGVDELIQLVEKGHLVAMVGYQFRFHPLVKRVHALLAEGKIGKIISVRAEAGEYMPAWHKYEDYRQMYAARKDLGGGVLLSQIHEFDYLYWFFGTPDRVFASGGHLSNLEIDVEDTAEILMESEVNGRVMSINVHLDYIQRPPSRNLKIIGDAGKICMDMIGLSLQVYDASGVQVDNIVLDNFQRNDIFIDQTKHFLACLRGKARPPVTLRDGAQSLRMAIAVKQSMETGTVVTLKRKI